MRLLLAAACLLWFVLVPYAASALGLGEIDLDSSLNEPFKAEIALETSDPSELERLTVSLASRATFERYGLDRPGYLSDFQFAVKTNSAGGSYIELTSTGPVAEPFVTLLLDVQWSSGRLLREYTVLLDPPVFEPETVQQSLVPAQSTPAKQVSAAGEVDRQPADEQQEVIKPTGLFQESAAETAEQPAEQPVAEQADTPSPAQPVTAATAPPLAVGGTYVAQRGDTLWRIAERVRGGTGLSNNQMMLALYRANPDAFLGNINELKAGAILRVPEQGEAATVSADQATVEVKQQHAVWSSGADEAQLELVAPGEDLEADATARPGETAGESATAGAAEAARAAELETRLKTTEQELAESQRLLQLRDAELQALQQRVAELEQTAGEAPIEVEEPADPEADPADIFADEELLVEEQPGELEAPLEEAAETPFEAEPAIDVGEEAAPESGGLFSDMWIWVGAAILLLFGLAVMRRRKTAAEGWEAQREDPEFDNLSADAFDDLPSDESPVADETAALEEGAEDIFADAAETDSPAPVLEDLDQTDAERVAEDGHREDVSDDFNLAFDTIKRDTGADTDLIDDATVEPQPDVSEAEAAAEANVDADIAALDDELELPLEKTISTGAPLNLDQADPIAEAEFHMAYGLYDQAADLLTRALDDAPDDRACRVKLIEVFFVWENKEGFLEQARLLRESVADESDSDWSKVLILGKQLCPDEALFEGDASSAPTVDSMDLELTDAGETDLDFSLSGNEIKALDMPADADGDLDLDLGMDFGDEAAADDAELTFDLGDEAGDSENANDDATMESPTVDIEGAGAPTIEVDMEDVGASTMETPTIESPMFDPTVELPSQSDDDSASTMETPTIEADGLNAPTEEMPVLDEFAALDSESASEEELKDPTSLDVDLSGLADFEDFDDEENNPTMLEKVDDIMAVGDGEISGSADDGLGDILFEEADEADEAGKVELSDASETIALDDGDALFEDAVDADLAVDPENVDFDLGTDTEAADDTIEQPQAEDIDGDTAEQPALDADSSSAESFVPDDATMTEVGTKLDLARAYIDMGDPEGARSILTEVLDEGGQEQQQEARQLLDELSD